MIEQRTENGLPPMHPGELLREEILPALGRTRVEIAQLLRVSRQALHAVLSERASVTPEMALRLGKLCGNGPELWLALQAQRDLERTRREKAAEIEAIASGLIGHLWGAPRQLRNMVGATGIEPVTPTMSSNR
jgi:antitoxin HigA-1